jgi:hypothetical protein
MQKYKARLVIRGDQLRDKFGRMLTWERDIPNASVVGSVARLESARIVFANDLVHAISENKSVEDSAPLQIDFDSFYLQQLVKEF